MIFPAVYGEYKARKEENLGFNDCAYLKLWICVYINCVMNYRE